MIKSSSTIFVFILILCFYFLIVNIQKKCKGGVYGSKNDLTVLVRLPTGVLETVTVDNESLLQDVLSMLPHPYNKKYRIKYEGKTYKDSSKIHETGYSMENEFNLVPKPKGASLTPPPNIAEILER